MRDVNVRNYRSVERNGETADFTWEYKTITLDDGSLFYMLKGNLIEEAVLEPEGKVLKFELQGDVFYEVNVDGSTESGVAIRESFKEAVKQYINDLGNWFIVKEEDFNYEIQKVRRIQCRGLRMAVENDGDKLKFTGSQYYHVKDLLTITEQQLNFSYNPQNLQWFSAKHNFIEILDRLGLEVTK